MLPAQGTYLVLAARATLLALCGTLGGCVLLDTVQQDLSQGKVEDCLISRYEGSGLVGAYLRQVEGTPTYSLFAVEGRLRRSGVPRDLFFDNRTVPWFEARDGGAPSFLRRSSAAAWPGFPSGDPLPAIHDFAYLNDGVDYAGPIVTGPSPAGRDLPTTGNRSFSGRAEVTLHLADGQGGIATTTAHGRFEVEIGYGAGRSAVTLSGLRATEGGALPFSALDWSNLGHCGPRVISSGQGSIRVVTADGRATSPFAEGRTVPKLRASFEAAQFAAPEGGPPSRFGGVFLIEADAGSLIGVFLSDGGA
ncbi:hypothetical protein [Rhodovulum steppense]|uniref:Transferrin-binding protein B C-lobe/N-lobe beta barrel domain-containing protein n=1 Tax=Rhodovulum steppense TaxID=540251 RepID=A0A4R1YXZ7_9RHOB|nr:hypothetical protein [Rhodovulum steppense]TCM86122.1 hypothetical protein EV216_10587 [Rhodovulum steppense]